MFGEKCAEDTVYESGSAVAAESFRQLDSLIDRDLDGHVAEVAQFVQGEPQHIAVDDRQLIDGPFRRKLGNQRVERALVGEDSEHQVSRKICTLACDLALFESIGENTIGRMVDRIDLKESLECQFSREPPLLHSLLAFSPKWIGDVFDVNIHRMDRHSDHVRNRTADLALQ